MPSWRAWPAARRPLGWRPPAPGGSGSLSGQRAAILRRGPEAVGARLDPAMSEASRGLDVNALGRGHRVGDSASDAASARRCGSRCHYVKDPRAAATGSSRRRGGDAASCSIPCPPAVIAGVAARRRGHAPEVDVLPPQGTDRAALRPAGVVAGVVPEDPRTRQGQGDVMDRDTRSRTSRRRRRAQRHRPNGARLERHGARWAGYRPVAGQARAQGRDRARGARPLRRVVAARAPLAAPPAATSSTASSAARGSGSATCATSRSAAGRATRSTCARTSGRRPRRLRRARPRHLRRRRGRRLRGARPARPS